ncbi:MAG: hypothetical protein U0V73_12030 [Acidimicrobiia bacterium]
MKPVASYAETRSPRWSIAGRFLEGLVTRDFERVGTTLDRGVRLRALLPRGAVEWHGREAAVGAFRTWFGSAEQFEVVDATIGEVAGRLQLSWRIRVRPAPADRVGWHLVEQQAYADVQESIGALDLLCSGFRAEPVTV